MMTFDERKTSKWHNDVDDLQNYFAIISKVRDGLIVDVIIVAIKHKRKLNVLFPLVPVLMILKTLHMTAHIRPIHSRHAVCVVRVKLLGSVCKCKLNHISLVIIVHILPLSREIIKPVRCSGFGAETVQESTRRRAECIARSRDCPRGTVSVDVKQPYDVPWCPTSVVIYNNNVLLQTLLNLYTQQSIFTS